jgi:hypothetical protein
MKSSEEAIDKVLAGLRDAEAPDGMERRILERLDERVSMRSGAGWLWLRPIWLMMPGRPLIVGSLACGVALAAIFAIVVAVPAIRRLGHAPSQSPTQSKVNSGAAVAVVPATSAVIAARPQVPLSGSSTHSMRKTKVRSVVGVRDSDAVALGETRDPSFPAPPLPLTDQERLLLRIVHKRDPVEMAELNPAVRAARDEEDKRAVQRFFEPSTTGDDE